MINKNRKIIGLTTDPYDNIYGYALVFIRLFDYLQKSHPEFETYLYLNKGLSSSLVKNKNFIFVELNSNQNLVSKTLSLAYKFIQLTFKYERNTIIIANCEIPELLAAWILKIKFKNVYCVFQDDRVRNNSFYTRFVCWLRVKLVYRIKNVYFTNKFTINNFSDKVNKFYIGNPIF